MNKLFLSFILVFALQSATLASLSDKNFSVDPESVTSSGKRSFDYYKYKKAPKELRALFPKANKKDRIVFHKLAFMIKRDFFGLSTKKLKDPKVFKSILKLNSLSENEGQFSGSKPLAFGKNINFKYTQGVLGGNEGDDLLSTSNEEILSNITKLNNLGAAELTLFQDFYYFSNIFRRGSVSFFFYPVGHKKTLVVSYGVLLVKAKTANSFLLGRVIRGQLDSRMKEEFENLKENRMLIFD